MMPVVAKGVGDIEQIDIIMSNIIRQLSRPRLGRRIDEFAG